MQSNEHRYGWRVIEGVLARMCVKKWKKITLGERRSEREKKGGGGMREGIIMENGDNCCDERLLLLPC